MKVTKRDGTSEVLDTKKIVRAMAKSIQEAYPYYSFVQCEEVAEKLIGDITNKLFDGIGVEAIQDVVEEVLMAYEPQAAKKYILYRQSRQELWKRGWDFTELQRDIYNAKYRYKNESFQEFVARVGLNTREMQKLILEKKFIPAGRILAGLGVQSDEYKVSLANCHVLPIVGDTREEIFDAAKNLAMTFGAGGGQGINLGGLRPRGAKVRNSARTSTGAVSFMELYDVTAKSIGGDGRRSALLISLPVSHPDIEEFISIKSDNKSITGANISVMVNDEFMRAVENDEDYTLSFTVDVTGETFTKVVRAKELFRKLAENNYNYAEPGILYWDRATSYNLLSEDPNYKLATTNPCQPKGEYILTKDGFKKIEDIVDKVYLEGNEYDSTPMFKTGHKEVYSVELENGSIIRMTDNHKITTPNGDVELRNLTAGDKVSVDYHPIHDFNIDYLDNNNSEYKKGVLLGWLIADGSIFNKNDNKGYVEFIVGENEFEVKHWLEELIKEYDSEFKFIPHYQKPNTCLYGRVHKQENRTKLFHDLGIVDRYDKFNVDFYDMSKDMKLGLLRALFTCDGSSRCEGISTLYSINKSFLYHVQRLLKEFGVYSTITLHNNERSYTSIDGIVRNNSATYKIGVYDVDFKNIGFLTNYKNHTMLESRYNNSTVMDSKKKSLAIKSIEYDGIEDVYDITVDKVHHYNTNGLIVHNCGEQPLPAHSSCNLASINLSEFVINPFTEDASIDFDGIVKTAKLGIRYLDEILDINNPYLPLVEQQEQSMQWRQVGLGVMGFSDLLIKMGVHYDSEEALEIAELIAYNVFKSSVESSLELSKLKGRFPMCNPELLADSPLFDSLPRSLVEEIKEFGLRNSHLVTTAPTGSISNLIGVSSGVEPHFALSYTRKTESINKEDAYYTVNAPIVEAYLELHPEDRGNLPDYFVTSMELPYMARIKMQSVWQKYVDTAISSTVNLPAETTIEEVEDLYMQAWKYGLKGITIFRDGGLREGILTTKSKEEMDKEKQNKEKLEAREKDIEDGEYELFDPSCNT